MGELPNRHIPRHRDARHLLEVDTCDGIADHLLCIGTRPDAIEILSFSSESRLYAASSSRYPWASPVQLHPFPVLTAAVALPLFG
jgi:hypothetical protein